MTAPRNPAVFIPALLCDEALYGDVIHVQCDGSAHRRHGGRSTGALARRAPRGHLAPRRADDADARVVGLGRRPVPVAVGRQLAADLPNTRFAALAGCGHLPTLAKPADSAARFREPLAEAR